MSYIEPHTRASANDLPWCNLHQCRPGECWGEHNPNAYNADGVESTEELAERLQSTHKERQSANGYRAARFNKRTTYYR